jgi:SAM-dependent methyltransferase
MNLEGFPAALRHNFAGMTVRARAFLTKGRIVMTGTIATNLPYALGHSDFELKRLSTQARIVDPITRRFFIEAGIGPGMRVLDVGSGAGDVAMLLARLVGPGGTVVGSDTSAQALATARQRINQAGLTNVSFADGDPSLIRFEEPFDAVAGRYVLQFVPDGSAALARLSRHLRPGGIVAFHELDWKGARSVPDMPLYDRCCALCAETIGRLGAKTSMGPKLHDLFVDAGLPAPSMRLESFVGAGDAREDGVRLVTDLVATLLPDMERLGIVRPGEVDIETLPLRVLAEADAVGGVVIGRSEIGTWCRV